jgi:hypothetical protein
MQLALGCVLIKEIPQISLLMENFCCERGSFVVKLEKGGCSLSDSLA